jgi:hypothetical protein
MPTRAVQILISVELQDEGATPYYLDTPALAEGEDTADVATRRIMLEREDEPAESLAQLPERTNRWNPTCPEGVSDVGATFTMAGWSDAGGGLDGESSLVWSILVRGLSRQVAHLFEADESIERAPDIWAQLFA